MARKKRGKKAGAKKGGRPAVLTVARKAKSGRKARRAVARSASRGSYRKR